MLDDDITSLAHIPLSERLCLSLKAPECEGIYPTSKIQKGLVLVRGSADLSGEGVGLGAPAAKFAHRVVFPGKACIVEQQTETHRCMLVVDFELNLEERVTFKSGKSIRNESFYRLKERFAGLHKAIPISRGLVEHGNRALRFMWGLTTTFETTPSAGSVRVSYTVDRREGVLHVSVDASRLNKTGCTEMILLNEQDGSLFDRYSDANGVELVGKAVGTWEETDADYVMLSDSHHDITLALRSVAQSRMYRGREVAQGRLSWTGVAYIIPPRCIAFDYDVVIREAL